MIRLFVIATLLAGLSATSGAHAQSLQARPHTMLGNLPPGETALANAAVAYRPRSAPQGPLPLIVLLHGASGYPLGFLENMEPIADRRGLILLYPHSRGQTWDFIQNMAAERDPWRGGLDTRRLDQSMADLFARAEIDSRHVVLLGFSDGASYALSLGVANPRLFNAVVALSPGMFVPSNRAERGQRVFVAHGRRDHILSFDNTSETIVRDLGGLGVALRFRPFDGDHEIDPTVLDEALDFALGLQAQPAAPTSLPK